MSSMVEICNLALYNLGDDAITSIEDTSKRGKLCKAFYPVVRDAVLRAYPWNCAKNSQALVMLAAAPVKEEWTAQFTLPTSPYCLWVPKFMNEDLLYEISGRVLYANETSIILSYIYQVTDPGLFDPLLVETIAARMSSSLAYPLTGVQSNAKLMWDLYEIKLSEARRQDGMENGEEKEYESNALIEVR